MSTVRKRNTSSMVQRPISSFFLKKPRDSNVCVGGCRLESPREDACETQAIHIDRERRDNDDNSAFSPRRGRFVSNVTEGEAVVSTPLSTQQKRRGEGSSGKEALNDEDEVNGQRWSRRAVIKGDGKEPTKSLKVEKEVSEYDKDGKRSPETLEEAREERHALFQRKLVGDGTSNHVMGRIRTQKDVTRPLDGKMTPLERQVADLQRRHPDCVLAIECGYKFRFFGGDAEIASEVLGIFSFPDRNYLTAAVPAATIDRHVQRLVLAGHKVGVVTQTETAAIKKAGDTRNKLFERQLSHVYTAATLEAGESVADVATATCIAGSFRASSSAAGRSSVEDSLMEEQDPISMQMGDRTLSVDAAGSSYRGSDDSSFLVCVVEEDVSNEKSHGKVDIGIVAIETSTGHVLYSQCRDDPMRAELESRLMFAAPSDLVIVEPVSNPTHRLLENYAARRTRARVERVDGAVYRGSELATSAVASFYQSSTGSSLGRLPSLVLRALAHSLDYLKPFRLESVLRQGASFVDFADASELALSPNTLDQLEILQNSDDGREYGSLMWLMDRTITKPGSRMLRRWVSRPLRNGEDIDERLDAVEEILRRVREDDGVLPRIPAFLKRLPDLEKILARCLHKTASPCEFLALIQSFAEMPSRLNLFGPAVGEPRFDGVSSTLLKRLLSSLANSECIAIAREALNAIDSAAASQNEKINLFVDTTRFADVTEKRVAVQDAKAVLDNLRPYLAKRLNAKSVEYVSIQNQGDYLVEIAPDLERRVPSNWERVSSTKRAIRFRPPEVKTAVMALEIAIEHLHSTVNAAWKRLLSEFCEYYADFRAALQSMAQLDCLLSFASLAADRAYVRPSIVGPDEPTQLHIVSGRHPVLDVMLEGTFVPNDVHLQSDETREPTIDSDGRVSERCAVVTGPNMGGKSCFIRQAALIACMAQMGSFVPAASCKLSAFDAIFTRMGAADNIALGRSTFLEELGETSKILSAATRTSLVIIDELGRGTSTRDGQAIAAATLEHIVNDIKCLSLFVTHYPEVARLDLGPVKGAYCMAHVSNKDMEQGLSPEDAEGSLGDSQSRANERSVPKVTFLYKAEKGLANASYGINVAGMAGLPSTILKRATAIACNTKTSEEAKQRNAPLDGSILKAAALLRAMGSHGGKDELKRIQSFIASSLDLDQENHL